MKNTTFDCFLGWAGCSVLVASTSISFLTDGVSIFDFSCGLTLLLTIILFSVVTSGTVIGSFSVTASVLTTYFRAMGFYILLLGVEICALFLENGFTYLFLGVVSYCYLLISTSTGFT